MANTTIEFLEQKFRPELAGKPLILDADGVLLDFASGFTSYMHEVHGVKATTNTPAQFDFSDAFPDTPKVAKHIPGFLESDHFLAVKAYHEANDDLGEFPIAEILQFLHMKGVELHLVSSVATTDTVKESRLACLEREFGPIFKSTTIIGLGESKAAVLKGLPSGFFVDDQLSMCKDGSLAGHLSFLKTQNYNTLSCKNDMATYGIEHINGLIDLPYFIN